MTDEILSLKEKIKHQWLYEHDDDLFEILRAFNDMHAQKYGCCKAVLRNL